MVINEGHCLGTISGKYTFLLRVMKNKTKKVIFILEMELLKEICTFKVKFHIEISSFDGFSSQS